MRGEWACCAATGRAFAIALVAVSRSGADAVLLNSDLAPAEVAAVVEVERLDLVLVDGDDVPRPDAGAAVRDLRDPVPPSVGGARDSTATRRRGRLVMLTSGHDRPRERGRAQLDQSRPGVPGHDAGAPRPLARRIRDGRDLAAVPRLPLGFLALGLALGLPVVVRRRLDVDAVAATLVATPGCVLVGVPPVLSRIARVLVIVPLAFRYGLRRGSPGWCWATHLDVIDRARFFGGVRDFIATRWPSSTWPTCP